MKEFRPLLSTVPRLPGTYIDVKTTGFHPKTSSIYAIGTIFPGEEGVTIYFADKPGEEPKILGEFLRDLHVNPRMIHYYGKKFDIPFLKQKAKDYNMNLPQFREQDLYEELSIFKEDLHLPSLSQRKVGDFFQIPVGDLKGKEEIDHYDHFLKTGKGKEELLLHLEKDLLFLPALGEILKPYEHLLQLSQHPDLRLSKISRKRDQILLEGSCYVKSKEEYYSPKGHLILGDNYTFQLVLYVKRGLYQEGLHCWYLEEKGPVFSNIPFPVNLYPLAIGKELLKEEIIYAARNFLRETLAPTSF